MGLYWQDADDIAYELIQRYPDKEPLDLRFTDLKDMITDLPGFEDDPNKSSEGILEAIQMAWYEEWADEG
ncbi:MAG: Fe-S cluster assembly protein IscX [Leptospirillia bacterium]